ncbi:dihydropteroate synthase [Pelosinus propionicus]|uniref:Dihydropteroate synthase n=1 Tax=Pelosinus propionicus DSM 13327 TaxID=1123291 RepID=A0A1I4K033_9FIRM|nr:dihydropteroate synthase [Pelosinus propionicus]SFL71873.1 Dihydropteroate synthase [Pelosinus propionicus DSM 13327]
MTFHVRALGIDNLKQAQVELAKINCDKTKIPAMDDKVVFRVIKLENISTQNANFLKQAFLVNGGEVVVGRSTIDFGTAYADVLLCATKKQFQKAISQLKIEPWGLSSIAEAIERTINNIESFPQRSYNWQHHSLKIMPRHTLIMGILNVTPDSFSDGGKYNTIDKALYHVEQMIQCGADIIDIGAESTRPYLGAEKISAEEEMNRLGPLLERVLSISTVPVSVDTYKSSVALEALKLGAHMINDIWGLQQDQKMARVVAEYNAPIIIMHNQDTTYYQQDIMSEIYNFLQKSISIGIQAGIDPNNIIIDPGIGFGKTPEQNLIVMSRLDELRSLGCPILLGTSNKRFIGEVLGLSVEERSEGTGATVSIGIMKGSNIVRVHNVQAMTRIARMTDAMMRSDI